MSWRARWAAGNSLSLKLEEGRLTKGGLPESQTGLPPQPMIDFLNDFYLALIIILRQRTTPFHDIAHIA